MYIKKIDINNFRNFVDFTMEFNKGLNVLIGANNSGKTGLLYAIYLLKNPTITINDFNKYNLMKYSENYLDKAPEIDLEFTIHHEINENDVEDESIVKLLSFLGMDEILQSRKDADKNEGKSETETATEPETGAEQNIVYNLVAHIKMHYSIDPKYLNDYKAEVAKVTDFDSFYRILELYLDHYYWTFTDGTSNTEVDKKEALGIFDIQFISAERTKEEVSRETKREIDKFTRDQSNIALIQNLKAVLANQLQDFLKPALDKLSDLFANEKNEIGLLKGNVAIAQSIKPNISISDAYVTDVKDTKSGYTLPLEYNGLGYNNLISIYILIKLSEIRKGKDFKILCLEEPEAHLHPAMQYKLFKYLRDLDEKDELNQQIFVTTHSSNISAVAGLDNMFLLSYDRETDPPCCVEQSLCAQFQGKGTDKDHLAKFLDVTRSDMLFADKVILVEGIAEKLLLPKFLDKLGLSYEDEHISIVEIGGKHFDHFIELFNGNKVKKKVLCLTDNDFLWLTDKKLVDYKSYEAPHICSLKTKYPIDNLKISTQNLGGRTFEDELFFANISNEEAAKALLKIATSKCLDEYIDANGINYSNWAANSANIDGRARDKVHKLIDSYSTKIINDEDNKAFYEKLFFADLFLQYAKNQKGDVALKILVNEDLMTNFTVPNYIKEGLTWLLK